MSSTIGPGEAMKELEAYERLVNEADGISVGQRVRASERIRAKWMAANIDRDYIERWSRPGTVERIVQHKDGLWTSVFIRFDDSTGHILSPDDLVLSLFPNMLEPA
jgi:hypothetical protein